MRAGSPLLACQASVHGGAAEGLQVAATLACGYANLDVKARYDARNPQALERLVANGALLHRFSQALMESCLRASNEVKLPRPTPTSRRSMIRRGLPGRRKSLVAGRGILLRKLHDPHPPEGVRASHRKSRFSAGSLAERTCSAKPRSAGLCRSPDDRARDVGKRGLVIA